MGHSRQYILCTPVRSVWAALLGSMGHGFLQCCKIVRSMCYLDLLHGSCGYCHAHTQAPLEDVPCRYLTADVSVVSHSLATVHCEWSLLKSLRDCQTVCKYSDPIQHQSQECDAAASMLVQKVMTSLAQTHAHNSEWHIGVLFMLVTSS